VKGAVAPLIKIDHHNGDSVGTEEEPRTAGRRRPALARPQGARRLFDAEDISRPLVVRFGMPGKTRGAMNAVTSPFESLDIRHELKHYRRSAVVFAQGDPCTHVFHLQRGSVKLSVLSKAGKEAIVSVLQPGDFFGEGCLAGQPLRMATATAVNVSVVAAIEKAHMIEMLHERPRLNDQFLAHMLARNLRMEEDLIDQLFNSAEKRLARTLLLLARYGTDDGTPQRIVPKLSQTSLAEIVGTTRGRVSFFMNKFRKLGFIDYNGGIKIRPALLSVVLHQR
jgi:CRP/FNR family cyclic AMP-dependent transcriptional regulator